MKTEFDELYKLEKISCNGEYSASTDFENKLSAIQLEFIRITDGLRMLRNLGAVSRPEFQDGVLWSDKIIKYCLSSQ